MAVNNQGPAGMASAAQALKQMLNETIGPMAALGAGAAAFVKYMAGAALNAEKMAAALRASADAKRMESQFKIIMGSADLARKKVAELSKEAAKSPFSFQALGKAAMNLQVLSNGALASSRALKQVQDVAVATGTPVDAVAAAMGDLVGSLNRGGEGAGQAAAQLAAMGAISQQTAERINELASSGAPASEAMRLVESDTKKASGAASELANTIDGLTQQMENLQGASDAKIGAMFEEGEKAGLRAAMGFQKFNNSVQEAAAGPWSVIIAGFNSIKESVGNFLGRAAEIGAVKTIMQALGAASVAILGVLVASFIAGAAAVLKFVAATRVAQAAMTGLMATTRAWGALMTGVSGGLTIVATGLALLALKAANARAEIKGMTDELKRSGREGGAARGALVEQAGKMQTPEDQAAAKDAAKTAVANARDNLEQAKARAAEAKKARDEYFGPGKIPSALGAVGGGIQAVMLGQNPVTGAKRGMRAGEKVEEFMAAKRISGPDFTFGIEGAKRDAAVTIADVGVKQAQDAYDAMLQIANQINSVNQATLALDQKRTQEARERAKLEKEIANEARQTAAQMGAGSMEALQSLKSESAQRRRDAEVASGVADEGSRKIAEISGAASPEIGAADSARAADIERKFKELRNVEATAPSNDFDVTRNNAMIAQRQMLMDEYSAAQGVMAGKAPDGSQRAPTQEEISGASAVIQTVKRLMDEIGGAGETSGARIGALQTARDAGVEKMDQGAAIRADESNARLLQSQAVAEAEAQYSMQRLRNEEMIAQLKKSSAQVAQEELQAQIKAAQELKEAQTARAAIPAEDKAGAASAQKRLDAAETAAAAAGVGGRSVEELLSEQVAQLESQKKSVEQRQKQAQLEALRIQEEFGPDQAGARKKANALEDEMKKEDRARELGQIYKDPADAKRIAGMEVDMERAVSNIAEMGQPRMSEMASMGGSANWAGLVSNSQKEIQKLTEINKQMKAVLDSIKTDNATALSMAREALARAQAES